MGRATWTGDRARGGRRGGVDGGAVLPPNSVSVRCGIRCAVLRSSALGLIANSLGQCVLVRLGAFMAAEIKTQLLTHSLKAQPVLPAPASAVGAGGSPRGCAPNTSAKPRSVQQLWKLESWRAGAESSRHRMPLSPPSPHSCPFIASPSVSAWAMCCRCSSSSHRRPPLWSAPPPTALRS